MLVKTPLFKCYIIADVVSFIGDIMNARNTEKSRDKQEKVSKKVI